MKKKNLIQLLLPLYDENSINFPAASYSSIKQELTEKFGGLTIYTRSPAVGLWKENDQKVTRDEIIIYEVVVNDADHLYWENYKKALEQEFRQDKLMVRFTEIILISLMHLKNTSINFSQMRRYSHFLNFRLRIENI